MPRAVEKPKGLYNRCLRSSVSIPTLIAMAFLAAHSRMIACRTCHERSRFAIEIREMVFRSRELRLIFLLVIANTFDVLDIVSGLYPENLVMIETPGAGSSGEIFGRMAFGECLLDKLASTI